MDPTVSVFLIGDAKKCFKNSEFTFNPGLIVNDLSNYFTRWRFCINLFKIHSKCQKINPPYHKIVLICHEIVDLTFLLQEKG